MNFFKKIRFVVITACIAFVLWYVCLDEVVYHQYRFHAFEIIWPILRSGTFNQVFVFSWVERLIAIFLFFFLWLFEILIILLFQFLKISRKAKWLAAGFGSISLFFCIFGWNNSVASHATGGEPFQNPKKIVYPDRAMQCTLPQQPYNIVFFVIDTWRFDALQRKITPFISHFAEQSWQFENHYSGGNYTQPGIFSLFYSIPGYYWNQMLATHRAPILLHQLLQDHYQMNILGSASLHYPAFDSTVFREIKNLQIEMPGQTSTERDLEITQYFRQFIEKRNPKQPFFSFLFYDEVHDWCGSSQPYSHPFQPAIRECDRLALNSQTNPNPYLNRYRNAVHFVDALIGQDINVLKQQQLLSNTIVVITADHGEEFNDEHLGFWGHASRFDVYQTHVPFIVFWPKQAPRIVKYATTHYDLAPTLMSGALGCANPVEDYSIGRSLLNSAPRNFLIVGEHTYTRAH